MDAGGDAAAGEVGPGQLVSIATCDAVGLDFARVRARRTAACQVLPCGLEGKVAILDIVLNHGPARGKIGLRVLHAGRLIADSVGLGQGLTGAALVLLLHVLAHVFLAARDEATIGLLHCGGIDAL